MTRIIISIIVLCLIIPNLCYAREEYEFAKDYIYALGCWKNITEKYKMREEEAAKENDDIQSGIGDMTFMRTSIHELEMAKSHLEEYRNSKNEMIQITADGAYTAYDTQIQNCNRRIELMEKIYSPKATQNIDFGKAMSRISELDAQSDLISKNIMTLTIGMTHVLVDKSPDKDGHLSYLAITSQERKDLIKEVNMVFGDEVKGGIKAGQSYLKASGAALYKFLTGGHKSADER